MEEVELLMKEKNQEYEQKLTNYNQIEEPALCLTRE